MRRVLLPPLEALFRVLFTYDCLGEEHVPAEGPAVVAANHPSYLDPVLLSLQVRRPIHFMAWDELFRVPLLGRLMRAFGAFPVDVRPGHGREAFERARAVLDSGEVIGIFPEGKRSRTGWMEPALREGAARLCLATGAPLVPATITGAFRAWPHFRPVPRFARVRVRYQPPIDPAPYRALPEEEGIAALLGALRARVEKSLLPGVKADLRTEVLYAAPAVGPRPHEWLPPVALGALAAAKAGAPALLPPAAWLAALLAVLRLPQGRLLKWTRTVLPVAALLSWLPVLTIDVGLRPPAAPLALLAIVAGGLFPYLYERRVHTVGVVRGVVLAAVAHLAAQAAWPDRAGAHVALPVFLALFALRHRTVFWPYAAIVFLAYAALAALVLGAGPPVLGHLAAALGAAALERLWPYRLRSDRPGR